MSAPYLLPANILQAPSEIDALAILIMGERCASLLEIGAKFGGSLWRLAHAMPKGSRVVAVDLPRGTRAWKQSEPSLKQCMTDLQREGYDTHILWGDSAAPNIIEQAQNLGPFDIVFIDADHRLSAVTQDWINYGMHARLVAFHDISWERDDKWKASDLLWKQGIRIEVPVLWQQLKQCYRHIEFRNCPSGNNNGIGVLWRA